MTTKRTHLDSSPASPRGSIRKQHRRFAGVLPALVAAVFFASFAGATPAAGQSSRIALSDPAMPTLDRRMALLSRELDLDPEQQAAVRRLLLQQREQTLKVWSDETVPSAVRIKATHDVADRTAQQIRSLLNDAQRGRYLQPHSREVEQHLATGNLEAWMRGESPNGLPSPHD